MKCLDKTAAARRIGVSRWTIQRMVKDGRLPVVVLNRREMIPLADLDAYVTPDHP